MSEHFPKMPKEKLVSAKLAQSGPNLVTVNLFPIRTRDENYNSKSEKTLMSFSPPPPQPSVELERAQHELEGPGYFEKRFILSEPEL